MKYLFIIMIFALISPAAIAKECYVKTGHVQQGSEWFKPGLGVPSCQGIAAKNTVVCYRNNLGQDTCEDVSGDKFDLNDKLNNKQTGTLLDLIKSVYSPDATRYYGGKRLNDTEKLAGLPYGTILLPADTLQFAAADARKNKLMRFELYAQQAQNKAIFSSSKLNNGVTIPARLLQHGNKYKWQAVSQAGTFNGTFSVADKQDQLDFNSDLDDALANSDKSASTKYLLRAALAKEYGFTFDMHQSLAAARNTINKGGK